MNNDINEYETRHCSLTELKSGLNRTPITHDDDDAISCDIEDDAPNTNDKRRHKRGKRGKKKKNVIVEPIDLKQFKTDLCKQYLEKG